jgi:endogenous inhibitor of DNA gyrase (YacG/DUF329 family)
MEVLIVLGIIIFVILIGGGIILYFVNKAIRAVRNASNSIAGQVATHIAKEILEGDDSVMGDAMNSPAEPRSISDMTSVYTPAIARDFPDLNVRQLISSAENLLCLSLGAIQKASTGEDIDALRGIWSRPDDLSVTEAYEHGIENRIRSLRSIGQSEFFTDMRVHRTGIYAYQKNEGTCTITFQTSVEYFHYIKQNCNIINGSDRVKAQERYNLELIYIFDDAKIGTDITKSIAANCPNCGAPVKGLGNRQCEYCGTMLKTIDIRIWKMNKFSVC